MNHWRAYVLVFCATIFGCKHRPDAVLLTEDNSTQNDFNAQDTTPPETPPLELSDSQEAMAQLLSHRDAAPSCEDVTSLSSSDEILNDLILLSEQVHQPPWVGMRAAACVIEDHSTEAAFVLLGWTIKPDLLGLGWLVLDNLDAIPQDVAIAIATMAVILSPDIDAARRRISNSDNPTISAIGTATLEEAPSIP